MKEGIRRFRSRTRKIRERIERPFNNCFDEWLPPRKERSAFYVTGVTTAAVVFGIIVGTVMTEIRFAHQETQPPEIVVHDDA